MACIGITKLINGLTQCYSSNVPPVYNLPILIKDCVAIRETMMKDSVFMDFMVKHRLNLFTGVKPSPLPSSEEKEAARVFLKNAVDKPLQNSKPAPTSDKYLLIKKNKK